VRHARDRLRATDDGVFAILYALLVLALVGTAAVVVDLAMLRESRASTRSAADSAVLAAAASLNAVQPNLNDPRGGCERAWKYLLAGLGGAGGLADGSSTCEAFPAVTVPPTACPAAPIVATSAPSPGWTVRLTWPVPDGSELMTRPDLAPRSTVQAPDDAFDGLDPCARVGLEVVKTTSPIFAGVFGAGAAQTRAASVARGTEQGDSRDVVAALNILEPTRCEALTTTDQGAILVNGTGTDPGTIAVESDGLAGDESDEGNGCSAVIAPRGGSITAGTAGQGLIQAFALNPAPVGNPAKAYTNPGRLSPIPTLLPDRYGPAPVTDIFNCTSGACAPGGGPWINELKSAYGGAGAPATFGTLPDGTILEDCSPKSVVIVPVGNWYINCPTLKISTTLIFQGGVIVTAGAVEVADDAGCLAVNVPATACPLVNSAVIPVTTSPPPTGDAILYIRSGDLIKKDNATLLMPQTFTYLGNGRTDMVQGPGSLLWTTPLASDCEGDVQALAAVERGRQRAPHRRPVQPDPAWSPVHAEREVQLRQPTIWRQPDGGTVLDAKARGRRQWHLGAGRRPRCRGRSPAGRCRPHPLTTREHAAP